MHSLPVGIDRLQSTAAATWWAWGTHPLSGMPQTLCTIEYTSNLKKFWSSLQLDERLKPSQTFFSSF